MSKSKLNSNQNYSFLTRPGSVLSSHSNEAFAYEIASAEEYTSTNEASVAAMLEIRPFVKSTILDIATLIESTYPLVIPMVWSMYQERLWDPNYSHLASCVRVPVYYTSWSIDNALFANKSNGNNTDTIIFEDSATICITSAPCWEAFKRWGDEITESFYRALRAVRNEYSIDWEDHSETTVSSSYGTPKYRYYSAKPIVQMTRTIAGVKMPYGGAVSERKTSIKVVATLEIPMPPESEVNAANCRVVEEEVTQTVIKRVRRIKCE